MSFEGSAESSPEFYIFLASIIPGIPDEPYAYFFNACLLPKLVNISVPCMSVPLNPHKKNIGLVSPHMEMKSRNICFSGAIGVKCQELILIAEPSPPTLSLCIDRRRAGLQWYSFWYDQWVAVIFETPAAYFIGLSFINFYVNFS